MQENKKIVIDGVQWIVQDKNETSIILKNENYIISKYIGDNK